MSRRTADRPVGPDHGPIGGARTVARPGDGWASAVVDSTRRRLRLGFLGELNERLGKLGFMDQAVVFGASLLLSVLPMVIITSSLTDNRIEIDLSRHLGLTPPAARVVASLFTAPHSAPPLGLAIAMLLGVLGTLAIAGSVQRIYEAIFSQPHQGKKGIWRLIVWLAVLGAALAGEDSVGTDLRRVGDHQLVYEVVSFVVVCVFLLWTMHFLLGGAVPWRRLAPSAVATGVCGIGLTVVGALYFPSTIVSDSKLYGTIGVVFTLVSWFIAIGAVVILGGTAGAVWQERRARVSTDGDG